MKITEQLETLWYQAGSLAVVAVACTAALAVASQATEGPIKAAEAKDIQNTLSQVLPPGFADNDLLADTVDIPGADGKPVKVYQARRQGSVEGVIFQSSGKGYAGPVLVMMGVDKNGTVLGVRVVKHAETPGLGDKIEIAKDDWILDFNGKSFANLPLARWAVKKDGGEFDQFAGATITPRAVVNAVKGGLELFDKQRPAMLGAAAPLASAKEQAK